MELVAAFLIGCFSFIVVVCWGRVPLLLRRLDRRDQAQREAELLADWQAKAEDKQ